MFDPYETILGGTRNGPRQGAQTGPASPDIADLLGEVSEHLLADRDWGPAPRSYDWFGELDLDGLPDSPDFLDPVCLPSDGEESS